MKAYKIFEVMSFERGRDPKSTIGIGIRGFIDSFNNEYSMKSDEEKIEAKKKLMDILSNIEIIRELPMNKKFIPYAPFVGDKVKAFDLQYGLIFIFREGRTSYLVNDKLENLMSNDNNSPGKYAIEQLAKRAKIY